MKCLKCGIENAADAKFCKSCGQNLSAAVMPSDEATIITDRNTLGRFLIKERFKILKKLGEGGMGEVLLAEDIKLKRKVAIKSVLKSGGKNNNSKIRFLREAQAASQLDHPNICTIYEIYEEEDKDYIVMQYIDGVTLDYIIGLKQLSIDKILDIAIQICSGMIEAHSKGTIHRDIKPGNIMIDKKGVAKILDFGLAKSSADSAVKNNVKADPNLTEKGFVMGTVAYISPEQAKGKSLNRGTDIFSFGVVLYEMIEGKNPFRKDEQIETLYNVLNKEVEFTRSIPGELEQIIRKALEKDNKNRYADFSRLKEDLEAFQTHFTQLKEKKTGGGDTEIINIEEQQKLLKEVQKSSDKEDLGDLVYRIKKFKASTERVATSGKRKLKFLRLLPVMVLALAAVIFLVTRGPTGPREDKKFYICLHLFENKTGEKSLPDMVDYLLAEALNQFGEFKTINRETALSITGDEGKSENVDLDLLKSKFNVKYELTGEIERVGKRYTLNAHLKALEKGRKPVRITATGNGKDSFLTNQADLLARRVYNYFFPKKGKKREPKKVAKIFGTRWNTFSEFYKGHGFFKKLEHGKAAPYFLKSRDLLISKYCLSHSYYFTGKRKEALENIEEIIPDIEKLTPSLRLKVRAIEARFKFNYKGEIAYLKQLKDEFPFSKEIFYELGEAYFHHANPEQAIEYYKQAVKLDEHYSQAINHLGYCYAYIGNHNKAIEAFEANRDLDKTANSFDSLGDGYFYAGDLVTAEQMKKSALEPGKGKDIITYPYQTLADIYILKALYKKADEEALDIYRRLRGTKKDDAYVLSKQAFIQYDQRKYDNALEYIDRSLETFDHKDIEDDTAEAHWLKGLILLALNKVEESKEHLQWLGRFIKKYRIDRENFHAAFKYFIHLDALILQKENQADKAGERFKSLMDMKTKLSYWVTYYNYPFFHTEYVKYLSGNRRYDEALEEVKKCLEFNPNYIPVLWAEAEILEKLNRGNEAKAVYEKIAELYGESAEKNSFRNRLKTKL